MRQIPHGNAVDAQNVVGGVFGDVFLNARLMRDLGEIRGAEVLVDLHEHRVHRIRGRLIEVDIPVIGVQRVRAPGAVVPGVVSNVGRNCR